jgi:hypothetical protein
VANRVTQVAVEILDSGGTARVTQVPVEVLVQHQPITFVRTTQIAVEVLVPAFPPGVWTPPIVIPLAKPTVRGT